MRLEADLHTHTIASGHAYSTVKELAEAAAERGVKLLAITDHGVNMPGGPHLYHFGNLKALPAEIAGVEILKGVEANIIDAAGHLDMPERILRQLDVVLAGFHAETGYTGHSVEENTAAMVAVLHNPYVQIIVHPGNPEYPVDIEKVVQAARKTGKALELNDSSFRTSRPGSAPKCALFAKYAKRYGAYVAVNSDAHYCADVGRCEHAFSLVQEADIDADKVLNFSAERVKAFLKLQRARLDGLIA